MHAPARSIRSISILQTVVYSIDTKISADIKSKFMNTFSTPNGFSRLQTQGQIDLVQKENFAIGKIEREIGFEQQNELAYMLRRDSIFSFMMQKYNLNTTTDYNVKNTYITSPPGQYPVDDAKFEDIEINMLIDIPSNQQIKYSPTFLEKSLQFFIQYLALLIPSAYIIIDLILGGGFRRKILRAREFSEIKNGSSDKEESNIHSKGQLK